ASDELRAQGLALQELLHDVGRAVARVRSDVVDDGDVGVIQDARGPSLLLEALEAIRVAREGGREYLDGDVAAQARIFRPVHLAHSPRADRRDDLVGSEPASRGERHSGEFYRGQALCRSRKNFAVAFSPSSSLVYPDRLSSRWTSEPF